LDDELPEEFLVETGEVVERVENRVARAHAQEEGDLSQPGFQVDDYRRALAMPRQLNATVDGERRCPGPTFRAKKEERRGNRRGPSRLFAPRRHAPDGVLERLIDQWQHEKLVGASPHRLEDEVW